MKLYDPYSQHEVPDNLSRDDVIKSQKTDVLSFAKLVEQKVCRMQGCLGQYDRSENLAEIS